VTTSAGAQTKVVAFLGTAQTLAWASSYYLPAVLATPLAADLGVTPPAVFATFSGALAVSALLGPHAGRAIDRHGGRPVLVGTSLIFAAGLALLGLARGVPGLVGAWLVLGIGMGAGLYEAAFAALVRLYGGRSRPAITGVTLIAGFASTVGWPVSTLLETQLGWRGTCFAWAGLHLLIGLPLNALLPKAAPPAPGAGAAPSDQGPAGGGASLRATLLLTFVFAATGFISTSMAAHLPRLLQALGVPLAGAVLVGTLIGPSQVGARLLEFGLLRKVAPMVSARLAAALHPLGALAFLLLGAPGAVAFGILHGAGNGILTIAKGTLALAIFGPDGYGLRQGLLVAPARVAQALAPWLFGLLLQRSGPAALVFSAALGAATFVALLLLPVRQPAGARAAAQIAGP
jgi:predicted MFS family arabinose efflux permease